MYATKLSNLSDMLESAVITRVHALCAFLVLAVTPTKRLQLYSKCHKVCTKTEQLTSHDLDCAMYGFGVVVSVHPLSVWCNRNRHYPHPICYDPNG